MRRLFLLLLLIHGATAYTQDVPVPRSHVNDYADILSKEAARSLEAALSKLEREESVRVVLMKIPSSSGKAFEECSNELPSEIPQEQNMPSPFLILIMPLIIVSVLLATVSVWIPAFGCALGFSALLFYSGLVVRIAYLIPVAAICLFYGFLLGRYVRRLAGADQSTAEAPGSMKSLRGEGFPVGMASGGAISFSKSEVGGAGLGSSTETGEFQPTGASGDW